MADHVCLARHLGDGRAHVPGIRILLGQHAFTAGDFAALFARGRKRGLHGVKRHAVDQRTNQRGAVQRIADGGAGIGLVQALHQVVCHALVHDEAARGRAALAGRADGAEHDAARGHVQVGRGADDDGVVAAQLQQHAAEALRHARPHLAAHAGRTRGRHQGHGVRIHQGFADVAAADQHFGQPGGRVAEALRGLGEERLAGQRGQGGFFRRLPDHGIAANQRQRGIPGPHGHGEVERADHADHAQGVPGFHHAVAGALGGDGQAVQLARQAHGEIADVDHFLNFAFAFGDDLAGFQADQAAQFALVLAQRFAKQAQQLAAARSRHIAPRQAGLARAGDGGMGLGDRVLVDLGQFGAIDRAARAQRAAGERFRVQPERAQDVLGSVHAGSLGCLRRACLRLRVMPKWRFWKKIYYTKLQRELRNLFNQGSTHPKVDPWRNLCWSSRQSARPISATGRPRIWRWMASTASLGAARSWWWSDRPVPARAPCCAR